MSSWQRASPTIAFALAIMLSMRTARAQSAEDVSLARQAYDRGAAAYDEGEYLIAARELSQADKLAPNDIALELALKSAVRAGDAVLALTLAARADSRQAEAVLSARDEARAKLGGRVGVVTVRCPSRTPCTASLDDEPFSVGEARYVLVGPHRVVIDAGTRQAFSVRVDPAAAVVVEGVAAPAPPMLVRDVPVQPARGVAPFWFWLGAGVSGVLGGLTIASAIDTQSKHDTFQQTPSAALSNDGVDAQLRTNLLIATTTAVLITTAAIGLFAVRWEGPRSQKSPSALAWRCGGRGSAAPRSLPTLGCAP